MADAIGAGRLVERKPVRPLANHVRHIFVTEMANNILDGKDISLGFPAPAADATMGRFMSGQLITVSRKSAEEVDLEQLENVDDVWVLCFRKPPPGWRLLGRFAYQDAFIGLHPYDRNELDGRPTYTAIANGVITEWKQIIGDVAPLRSSNLGDYLTGVIYDADIES